MAAGPKQGFLAGPNDVSADEVGQGLFVEADKVDENIPVNVVVHHLTDDLHALRVDGNDVLEAKNNAAGGVLDGGGAWMGVGCTEHFDPA
mmetsp:Transcript_27430/g.76669  ORF Transcript_27430/g.76669 Transcript_27430/m.76669 type:complete len:90 (-) Transcript_27430:1155-1424(-)